MKNNNFDSLAQRKQIDSSNLSLKIFFIGAAFTGLVFMGGANLGSVLHQVMSFIN